MSMSGDESSDPPWDGDEDGSSNEDESLDEDGSSNEDESLDERDSIPGDQPPAPLFDQCGGCNAWLSVDDGSKADKSTDWVQCDHCGKFWCTVHVPQEELANEIYACIPCQTKILARHKELLIKTSRN